VHEQFQYHVFEVVLVVFTHAQLTADVPAAHVEVLVVWLVVPLVDGVEVAVVDMQQLYEDPLDLQFACVRFKFFVVTLLVLLVHEQFQYHDLAAVLVVFTHVQVWSYDPVEQTKLEVFDEVFVEVFVAD